MRCSGVFRCALVWVLLPAGTQLRAQARPAPANPLPAAEPGSPEPDRPHGQILIQSHGEPPSGAPPAPTAGLNDGKALSDAAGADVSDAERGALTFTAYDLDARVDLEHAGLSMRARVRVRNDGPGPLKHLPLQISSSLRWESATLVEGSHRSALVLAQHRLQTDADHTGAATEAVVTLPKPLPAGAAVSLDLFYAGIVPQSGERLARLGASAAQQRSADWDSLSGSWTGLRGFGNVLWYPVASPQLFLAEGNTLFTAIGRERMREQGASVRLRLSVAYLGEPPAAAYFCGRRAALKPLPDNPDVPTAVGAGIAMAEFPAEPLGFRLPSLFVLPAPETLLGGNNVAQDRDADSVPAASSSNPEAAGTSGAVAPGRPAPALGAVVDGVPLIALSSADPGAAAGLGAAADRSASLLMHWLGPRPLSALTVIDHEGQPFQDGPLVVAPAATLQTSPEAPALAYSLAHAWVQTGQPWMDEGLAQFFALLSLERERGRNAALAQMGELLQPVTFAEPELPDAKTPPPGEPLIAAPDELFYRRKAAAVWWMLRDLAGETALAAALRAWRTQPASHDTPEAQALGFEHLLERLSGKDLGWFFRDWVLRDRGLPDLSIVDVASSPTSAGPGHSTGWLVAVTVRNEGGATADVPLTVRSGQFSTSQRVRVPGFGQTTERVVVDAAPSEVLVNDGSTPESRTSVHSRVLETAAR